MPKKQDSCFIVACMVVISILIACFTTYWICSVKMARDSRDIRDSRDSRDSPSSPRISSPPQKDKDKICLSHDQYMTLVNAPKISRDRKVLQDPLFPPLNRTDTMTHETIKQEVDMRRLYVPTSDRSDQFRLVGYFINKDVDKKDAGGNSWKLFAREKDRHASEFYIVPTNNNYDIKIMITDDIVKGTRLRDLYTIPSNVSFSSPLLNPTPYEFVELPKNDLVTHNPVYL